MLIMTNSAKSNDPKNLENGPVTTNKSVKPIKENRKFFKPISDYFTEFSKNTGIHGLKYIGEQERSLLERSYWLIMICVSLYFCVSAIQQAWNKLEISPVTINLAGSPIPIWKIPFPAITICPATKSKQSVYNFTDNYHKVLQHVKTGESNLTEEELERFSLISLVCSFQKQIWKGNTTTSLKAIQYLINVAPPFDKVFLKCAWPSSNETCSGLFSPVLTEDGVCFTANMLNRRELFTDVAYFHDDHLNKGRTTQGWTIEKGYPTNAAKDTFPRRGSETRLYLVLATYEEDIDYACRSHFQGFKVILHHPAELPKVKSKFFRAAINEDIMVAVKPDMMITSPNLKNYDPHRRQCFFSQERRLKFFQIYTQPNCQVECLANYTLSRCGCVAYHMPRENSTQICGSGSRNCMSDAEDALFDDEIEPEMFNNDSQPLCDCLPSCTSITYNTEISLANFKWIKVFEAFKVNSSEFYGHHFTALSIYFRDTQFIAFERDELYGSYDFLANCGGLLGLFTGFSFLSIVEIIYFISLRLVCNIRKYREEFWSGSTGFKSVLIIILLIVQIFFFIFIFVLIKLNVKLLSQ